MERLCNSLRALIVDDNEVNLIVASQLLESLGVVSDTADSGEMALEMLREQDYHLVFMDLSMPGMNGVQTTGHIREMGKTIPVIALTADDAPQSRISLLEQGMDDYLGKPLDRVRLEEVLDRWAPFPYFHEKAAKTPEEGYGNALEALEQECGIQAGEACRRMGVPEQPYLQVVHTFYRQLPDAVAELRSAVAAEDWELYRIRVHGCKSALANIGAVEQSELARALEGAAAELDAAFVKERNDPLLESLEELYRRMTATKPLFTRDVGAARPGGDRKVLLEGLLTLEAMLEDLDNDGAEELLAKLTAYSYGEDTDDELATIQNCINDFDYDSAAEGIKKIRCL